MSRKLNRSTKTSTRVFNLKKDTHDDRDFMFKAEKLKVDTTLLPTSYDLRTTGFVPSVLDQGALGSCGPNQISNALRYCLCKEHLPDFQPSRLYIYYFTRLAEGSRLDEDTGISIRGGLKAIQKYGACSENNWGYKIDKFKDQPNNQCIIAGRSHTLGFKYIRVQQNLANIKQAIYGGFPVVVGINIYETFQSDAVAKTGTVPMPNVTKEACLGGHCVNLLKFDDVTQRFTCSNSWSTSWGDNGYFTLPYDYVLNSSLCSDMWIITFFK